MYIDPKTLPQKAPEFDLRELFEAGCHFGHQIRKWHPKMKPFIFMEKDGVHIFDLVKTAEQLQIAYNFAYDLGSKGKTLIVVGTKRQAKDIIETTAKDAGALYITSRWLGGLLTNWEQVNKSLKQMIKTEKGLAEGQFDAYTKYERVQLEKDVQRADRFFGGIRNLKEIPDALFVIDTVREKNAIKEAVVLGVPIIGMTDSNANPADITIPIPANDDALGSIKIVVEAVLAGYKAGKAKA